MLQTCFTPVTRRPYLVHIGGGWRWRETQMSIDRSLLKRRERQVLRLAKVFGRMDGNNNPLWSNRALSDKRPN